MSGASHRWQLAMIFYPFGARRGLCVTSASRNLSGFDALLYTSSTGSGGGLAKKFEPKLTRLTRPPKSSPNVKLIKTIW